MGPDDITRAVLARDDVAKYLREPAGDAGGDPQERIAAYLERLKAWPAFARAVKEAEPLFHLYPGA